jgi:Ni/Fe-hydrogenase 1 B-type cytochrome subunit
MLERRYVWEFPVRMTHWLNVVSIVMLSITGFYIGHPFIGAGEGVWIMGWMRFLHFTSAYLFLTSFIIRSIWFVVGNQYGSWRMFFPWTTAEGRLNALKFFRYYTFTGRHLPNEVGHNGLAVIAYAALFTLFVFQIVSGFALYGMHAPGGTWDTLFGWLLLSFDSQTLRLWHHLVMWLIIAFVINHLYSSWLMDVKERNGTISSIFSGYKYIHTKDR